MLKNKILILICFSLCIRFISFAQDISYYPASASDFLSEISVTDINQDKKGFIWLATYKGILRYDSYQTVAYSIKDSNNIPVPNSYVRSLYKDSQDNLYALSSEFGMRQYNPSTNSFELIRNKNKQILFGHRESIWDIQEVAPNDYWLVGNFGVAHWKKDQETVEYLNPFPNKTTCYSIEMDLQGTLWLYAGPDAIAYKKKNDTSFINKALILTTLGPRVNQLGNLFCDKSNRLWISNEFTGLISYDILSQKIQRHVLKGQFSKAPIVMHMIEAYDGTIWIATDGSGIYRYTTEGQWLNSTIDKLQPHSLPSNSVYTLYETMDKNIWVGMFTSGVVVYNKHKSSFHSIQSGTLSPLSLQRKSVLSIVEGGDKQLYIGTDGGGLEIWNRNQSVITPYAAAKGNFFTNVVKSLCSFKGNLYVGTYSNGMGVCSLGFPLQCKVYPIKNKMYATTGTGYHVWSIAAINDTLLCLGKLSGGIEFLQPVKGTIITPTFSPQIHSFLSSGIISSVVKISDSEVLVASEANGLLYIKIKPSGISAEVVQIIKDISYLNVQCVLYDKQNDVVWIGTLSNGLIQYDWKKRIILNQIFPEYNGQRFEIKSILKDNNETIWIGTDRGLVSITPQLNQTIIYTKEDGIPGNQFNTNSCFKGQDGQLYFGTTDGLLYFYPDKFKNTTVKQRTVITNIYSKEDIGNESVSYHDHPTNKTVVLKYGRNQLHIEFSALDYIAPGQVKYYYKLNGYEEHWNSSNAEKRIATYTKLPPGKYTFLVYSINREGRADRHPTALDIIILHPWYMTSWFYLSLLISIVVIVFLLFQWRTIRIRTLNRKLQDEVNRQTTDLVDINTKLSLTVEQLSLQKEALERSHEEITSRTNWILHHQRELLLSENENSGNVHTIEKEIEIQQSIPYGTIVFLSKASKGTTEHLLSLFSEQVIFYTFQSHTEIFDQLEETLPEIIVLNSDEKDNALTVYTELLSKDVYSHIPVIFILSTDSNENYERLKEAGVNYILKPPLDLLTTKSVFIEVMETAKASRTLVQEELTRMPQTQSFSFPNDEWLLKLIAIIEEQLAQPELNAEYLCKTMGVSKTLLYSKLRNISGQTVNELIRVIRLQKSVELLKEGKHTISEVAMETGFNSASYFTKSFTQFYGKPPKEFSKRKR